LLVRFDRGRQALVYDCFDFQPPLLCNFQSDLDAGRAPVDVTELARIEDLLHRTRQQRDSMAEHLARTLSHTERCAAYGASTLVPLASWIRYRQSAARRARFPVSAIAGARLVAFNATRPNDHLPPAEGAEASMESLGQPSSSHRDEEDPRVAVGAELGGNPGGDHSDVGPLAVLVLELAGVGAEVCSYAAMQLWPTQRGQRVRTACGDWTPSAACSRARRHYLVGDLCEMRELCNYLASESPHLARLLVPGMGGGMGMGMGMEMGMHTGDTDTKNNNTTTTTTDNNNNNSSSSSSSSSGGVGATHRGAKAARLDSEAVPACAHPLSSPPDVHTTAATAASAASAVHVDDVQVDTHAHSPSLDLVPYSNSLSHLLLGPLSNLHPRTTARVLPLAFLAARVVASGVGGGDGGGGKSAGDGSRGAESALDTVPETHTLGSVEMVHAFLHRCGVEKVEKVNPCLKAGLLKGHLTVPVHLLSGDCSDASAYLDTVLLTEACPWCDKQQPCTVRQALRQRTIGSDYGDGSRGGAVKCECGGGAYISSLCNGKPEFNCGKRHKHCTDCPDFGTCLFDYR
ncbi:hypothetical protein B484DRAFT_406853, partial [Ochromonadaceae sp. CCMP2298]